MNKVTQCCKATYTLSGIEHNRKNTKGDDIYHCNKCDKRCTLEDTPAHTEGWEERFDNNRPPKNWFGSKGYDEYDESESKEFGYRQYCEKTHTICEVTDWGNIKNFIKSERELLKREIVEAMQSKRKVERVTISAGVVVLEKSISYNKAIDDITNIINNIK